MIVTLPLLASLAADVSALDSHQATAFHPGLGVTTGHAALVASRDLVAPQPPIHALALGTRAASEPAPAEPEAVAPEAAAPGTDAPAPEVAAPPPPPPAPAVSPEVAAQLEELQAAVADLRAENETLKEDVEFLGEDLEFTDNRLSSFGSLTGKVSGYVDIGFFWVNNDGIDVDEGSGLRTDIGYQYSSKYDGSGILDSWVFLGDPLSVMINSRGDPADTGQSLAITFNPINNQGRASFLVNNVNLALFAGFNDYFTVDALIDFLPRTRDVSDPNVQTGASGVNLGDFVDVKLAYMRYQREFKNMNLAIYVGKFDSVVGYEYRVQESPDRISVTPSLICRYVCGRPLGLKARMKFTDKRNLILNLSVTNGATFWESFGFYGDVDVNNMKTFSGRLSYDFAALSDGLYHAELAASGFYGAQDLQFEDDAIHWQAGADFHLEAKGVDFTAEFVIGRANGDVNPDTPDVKCSGAPCLEYMGAYGILGYRAKNWLMPFVRVDWRDAVHETQAASSFVYLSDLIRVTPGVRFDINENISVKGEYTYTHELVGYQFRNDVLTTSMVARF